jgi:hypothetical protein
MDDPGKENESIITIGGTQVPVAVKAGKLAGK